jgi:hypothetical protein
MAGTRVSLFFIAPSVSLAQSADEPVAYADLGQPSGIPENFALKGCLAGYNWTKTS